MCQELILKYSSADPEQLLGVLPVEEVVSLIKDRMRPEVESEVRGEYQSQIDDLEHELLEEGDWRSDAESWECDAIGLYRAIEEAIKLPWSQAIPLLQKAMEDHGKDID